MSLLLPSQLTTARQASGGRTLDSDTSAPWPLRMLEVTVNDLTWLMGHYYRVQNWKKMTCKNQNWWGSFDRQGWSTCDAGWFMAGLYRTGHMRDWAQGTYQIEEAWCCKADDGGYGKCEEHSIFNSAGWSDCKPIDGKPSAMVGLWRSNQGDIRGIDKAKCCTMP